MRRRITVAVVAVALVSLVLAGVGTTLLSWAQNRRSSAAQLQQEATALEPFVTRELARGAAGGSLITGSGTTKDSSVLERRIRVVRQALHLVDASALVVDGQGRIVRGTLPAGVTLDDLGGIARNGGATSGTQGRLVWGASAGASGAQGRRLIVVLTRQVSLASGVWRWVLISSAVVLGLAVVIADLVARRLAAPFHRVQEATEHIAAGDLAARVGVLPGSGDDEAARLARSIDSMAESLQRARAHERDFLMSISHELRTPLTTMRGYAESIADGAAPDSVAAAEVIVRGAERLERLVADLLDLARLEARRFTFDREPVDFGATVQECARGFLPLASREGIALNLRGPERTVVVDADADRISQVVANLVENALKYAATTVEVVVGEDGPWASVQVRDDGPGIPVEDLPRVFDRHFVARRPQHTGGPRTASSGLGLTIARELVLAMGGQITASAEPVGGTMIEVRLARNDPNADSR